MRIRRDETGRKPYTRLATVLRSATRIASDVEGLRPVMASCFGDWYRAEVPDDGSEVRHTDGWLMGR